MTELSEPDEHRQEVESDEEEQGSRDIFVLVFSSSCLPGRLLCSRIGFNQIWAGRSIPRFLLAATMQPGYSENSRTEDRSASVPPGRCATLFTVNCGQCVSIVRTSRPTRRWIFRLTTTKN
jgi:hypothetical protein